MATEEQTVRKEVIKALKKIEDRKRPQYGHVYDLIARDLRNSDFSTWTVKRRVRAVLDWMDEADRWLDLTNKHAVLKLEDLRSKRKSR